MNTPISRTLPTLSFFGGTLLALCLNAPAHTQPGQPASPPPLAHAQTAESATRLQLLEAHIEALRGQIHEVNLRLYYEREKERFRAAMHQKSPARNPTPMQWGEGGEWDTLALNIELQPDQNAALRQAITEYFNLLHTNRRAGLRGEPIPGKPTPPLKQVLAPIINPTQMENLDAFLDTRKQIAIKHSVASYMARSLERIPMNAEQQKLVEEAYQAEAGKNVEQAEFTFHTSIDPEAIAPLMREILTAEQFAAWQKVPPF